MVRSGWLRGHSARCDAAPSLSTVLPLSVTIKILCNLNRPSWQHRCPRTLPAMPGKVILRRGVISKLGPGAHLCTKTPGTVMFVWGSSCARPQRTCVCLPQGIQPRDTARPVPRNCKTAEFMPDWWGSGPPQLGWPLSWTPAWVRPHENWRNRRCRFRVQGPESSAKGHSHVEKPLPPVQGLVLTGSHPGHLALKMTLSALAFRSPPDTSTTEHHFHFGPVSSFFLKLLVIALCSSCSCPVSY